MSQPAETEETEDKLTEYEIFQKLQIKEQKADRKRVSSHAAAVISGINGVQQVECSECGLHIPTNTIKRHQQKHEKDAERVRTTDNLVQFQHFPLQAKLLAENPSLAIPPPKVVSPKKKVRLFCICLFPDTSTFLLTQ